MKTVFALLLLGTGLSMGLPAAAAEIGRVELDGRIVILNDDNTWQYASDATPAAAPSGCTQIASMVVPVSVCLDPAIWERAELGGDTEHSFKIKDAERYLMVITESDFFPNATLKSAILKNAQAAAGLEKVNIVEEGEVEIRGARFNRITYQTIVDGIDATYTNYYTGFIGKGSLQLVFFSGTGDHEPFAPQIDRAVTDLVINR